MKKILLGLISVLMMMLFSGCATDKAYGVAKALDKAGVAVVKKSGIEVGQDLKDAQTTAEAYNAGREAFRGELEKSATTPLIQERQ